MRTTEGASPRQTRTLVLLAFVALLVPQAGLAQSIFTWSVPARFGLDNDGNGLIDYFTTAAAISPATWPIDVNACGIPLTGRRAGTTATFAWTLRRATTNAVVDQETRTVCTARLHALVEGAHIISLRIDYSSVVGPQTLTMGDLMSVKDHLIIGMGDSAASGEGAPDIAAPSDDVDETWQDRRCHRSARSGQALAARRLEDLDAKSSVTFVHVACSGATMENGMLNNSNGGVEIPPNAGDLPSQIDQVLALVGNRQIDGVMVSIGINDLDWGSILFNCMAQLDCDRNAAGFDPAIPDPAVALVLAGACTALSPLLAPICVSWVAQAAVLYAFVGTSAHMLLGRLPDLHPQYTELAAAIENDLGVTNASRVYIAGYLDPSRNESGNPCDPGDYGLDIFRTLFGLVSEGEFTWAANTALPLINGTIEDSAGILGWTFVTGIPEAFRLAGVCSSTRAVRRFTDSLVVQHDHHGTLHPNNLGYTFYRDRYVAHMRDRFAPTGNWTLSPAVSAVTVGQPMAYVLNWKHHGVWRDLTTLELRVRSGDDIAIWVRWNEDTDTFELVRSTGTLPPEQAHNAGTPVLLQTAFASLDVGNSFAHGSGSTGASVAVTFDLSFKNRAGGREWVLEVLATDDFGERQEFEEAGTFSVLRAKR